MLQYLLKLKLTELFFISRYYITLKTHMTKHRELAHLRHSAKSCLPVPPVVSILHHPTTVQE